MVSQLPLTMDGRNPVVTSPTADELDGPNGSTAVSTTSYSSHGGASSDSTLSPKASRLFTNLNLRRTSTAFLQRYWVTSSFTFTLTQARQPLPQGHLASSSGQLMFVSIGDKSLSTHPTSGRTFKFGTSTTHVLSLPFFAPDASRYTLTSFTTKARSPRVLIHRAPLVH
jgi:hypothetical protein